MSRSLDRAVRIDAARNAITAEPPQDERRETRWQYRDRLARAVVSVLFPEES